jgi:hypothetical protein
MMTSQGQLHSRRRILASDESFANLFPGASVLFSLRSLNVASDPVVRVRRDSDNSEQDFTAQEIINGTLTTFTGTGGGNNGLVTIWYDQSANNNNATQTTTSNQPSLVLGGVINLDNGRPCINFDGNSQYFLTNDYAVEMSTNEASVFSVINSVSNGYILTEGDRINVPGSNYSSNFILGGVAGSHILWLDSNTIGSLTKNIQKIIGFDLAKDTGNNVITTFDNSTQNGTITNPGINTEVLGVTGVGSRPDGDNSFFEGNMQDMIAYKSNQASNRTAIVNSINSHYQIF